MFAGARVPWPVALKQLWNIFSAFNLNIDIVAPECLVPGVSYVQKWLAFESIPFCVGIAFFIVHGLLLFRKKFILGQRSWETLMSHVDDLVSSYLILFFFLFLQLFKMQVGEGKGRLCQEARWFVGHFCHTYRPQLEVFDCGPLDPPDGKSYLLIVFEECGVRGGTQLTLLPWALLALFGYSLGYPVYLARFFYKNRQEGEMQRIPQCSYYILSCRELIMEDQLIRAKGAGDDKLTNPHAYHLRKRFGRTYYQFRPDLFFWQLCVILRKAAIGVARWCHVAA